MGNLDLMRQVHGALKTGREYAFEAAQAFHREMAGYKPQRHQAMDDEVREMDAAIAALELAMDELVNQGAQLPQMLRPADGCVGSAQHRPFTITSSPDYAPSRRVVLDTSGGWGRLTVEPLDDREMGAVHGMDLDPCECRQLAGALVEAASRLEIS